MAAGLGRWQGGPAKLAAICCGLLAVISAPGAAAEETAEPSQVLVERGETIRIFEDQEDASRAGLTAGKRADVGRPSPLSAVARTGFWLGLVVLLLCALIALGKKVFPRSMGMFRSPAMELLGRSYLDPKRCVYLLKVGGKILVVGSSENGLSCLSEVGDSAEVEHLTALSRNGGSSSHGREGFAAALQRKAESFAAPGRAENTAVSRSIRGNFVDRRAMTAGAAGGGEMQWLGELKEQVAGIKARLKTIS